MTDLIRQAALREASVPTLLMCVAQLTRDPRWLEPPFRPQRDVSIFADPTGGLPPAVQQEIRDAAAQVLDELASGRRVLPPLPADDELVTMMGVCLGDRGELTDWFRRTLPAEVPIERYVERYARNQCVGTAEDCFRDLAYFAERGVRYFILYFPDGARGEMARRFAEHVIPRLHETFG